MSLRKKYRPHFYVGVLGFLTGIAISVGASAAIYSEYNTHASLYPGADKKTSLVWDCIVTSDDESIDIENSE